MNVLGKFDIVQEFHSPKIIGEVNDVYIKIAKILGNEIPWHNHANEDELFFILEGELVFEQEGTAPFTLKTGDMHIVKKGINHKVSSLKECKIMLVENKSTLHTGQVKSEVTKSISDQL